MTGHYFTKSKVFLYFCLSFILGIAGASFLIISDLWLLVFLGLAIMIISIFWRNKKTVASVFCLIFLLGGIYRYNYSSASGAGRSNDIYDVNDAQAVSFEGIVASWPEQKINSVYYEIEPRNLEIGAKKREYKGKILAILPFGDNYQYGDLLELKGKIKVPVDMEGGSFSYKKYLANKDIYFLLIYPEAQFIASEAFCGNEFFSGKADGKQVNWECQKSKLLRRIFTLRAQMSNTINKSMPEPEASLASAILFGDDNAVPKDLIDKFNATGTRHIMAVSGQNITILALILMNFVIALGGSRRLSFYFTFISIAFYIILIGFPASAVRAGIMGLLILIAERTGRLSVSYRALVLAAAGMLALNPSLLVFDVGFQLSFAATAGIIFIYPLLLKYLKKIPNIAEARSSLAMTLAATATTLPISILSFNQFSPISLLANIFIVPLVPLVMILSFAIIIINAVLPFLTEIVGWFSWLFLAYEVKAVEFLSSFSSSLLKGIAISVWYAAAYYLILALVIFKLRKKEKNNINS